MKWMTSGPSTTSSIGLLQVFEIRSGRAVVTQQIRFNRLADGAGSSFDPETLRLTIKGVHGGDHGTPIIDTGKFFWDGKKFALLKKQPAARP